MFPVPIGEAAQLVGRHDTDVPPAASLPPDLLPRWVQTQEAYRLLLAGGFDGTDAAMLIGYVVGLPECDCRWSLEQINRLLLLRDLYSNTECGEVERLQN